MQVNSKEVASLVGCGNSTLKRHTKKALENGACSIEIKGLTFGFELVHGANGKAYKYTEIKAKKKVLNSSVANLNDMKSLLHIDLSKTVSYDDKLLIINFYKTHSYSLKSIVKSLYFENGIYPDDKKVASSMRTINRWIKQFKTDGKDALKDTRGRGNEFRKIDEDALIYAIVHSKAKANHDGYYRVWDFYCWMIAKKQGIVDLTPKAKKKIISYSAIVSAIKKKLQEYHQLNVWDKKGHDGLLQDYVIGVRDIAYINQEWQVDATKFDFMCRMEDGTIKRVNLTLVIDSYSGAAVGQLTDTINSYDQVRVLYKAFERMGIPETMKTDNGKDYASEHYKTVLLDNSVNQLFAEVGQGRQKGKVERFFNTFQTKFSLIPGYIGNDVSKRTKIENQNASKIAVRTSKATRFDTKRLLTYEELEQLLDNLIAKQSNYYTDFSEFMLSESELQSIKLKLGKSHTRKLKGDGVQVNNIIYQSADIWVNGLNKGEYVHIRENIDNVNEVFIYKDDQFICVAKNKELGVECMTLEEHKKAVKAQKEQHLKPFMKIVNDTSKWHEYQDEFVRANSEDVMYLNSPLKDDDKISHKNIAELAPTSPSNKVHKKTVNELDELMNIAGY